MAKTHKYQATLDGKVIGTRTTARVYTHAVIVRDNREAERVAAYCYKTSSIDGENFRYITERAIQGENHPHYRGNVAQLAGDRATAEAGYDAYIDAKVEKLIESYKRKVARGGFEPYVAAWCGRRDLALKAARRFGDTVVAVVPVELAPR